MNPSMLSTAVSLIMLYNNIQNTFADWGKATMYGGNIYGNACGMDGTADAFGNWAYAAIGSNNFDSGYGCGKCYTITCQGAYGDNPNCQCSGSITVQAIDQCPECSDSHFDINAAALASLTGGSSDMAGLCGVVSVTYERVDCSAITGNFKIINKDGTSIWWYGFHLNDVNDDGGIKSVELLKDGSWIATCTKDNGPSFWICNGLSANVPLDVKITSDLGKSVTAYNCITSLEGGTEMTCNTNLAGGDSSSGSSGSSSSSSTIQIKQNSNSNEWWMAIEFPNSDNSGITKLEMMDSNHGSWISGNFENWGTGAYSFNDGVQFSGNQHFRVTSSSGNTATSWNVFGGISGGSSAYITKPGSSFTTEQEDSSSEFPIIGVVAVVMVLSCIAIAAIIGYCIVRKRKQASAVSFDANIGIQDESKGEDTRDSIGTIEDGDSTQSKASNGYDMNPIEINSTV